MTFKHCVSMLIAALLLALTGSGVTPPRATAGVDTGDNSYEQEATDTQVDGGGDRDSGDKGMSKEEWEALKQKLNDIYQACIEAENASGEDLNCVVPPDGYGYGDAICGDSGGCTLPEPEEIARKVIAKLTMPQSTPVFGPDPSINKITPGKLVVGFPYWLTVPGEGFLTTTETSQGLRLRLDSRRVKVVYQMGDGTTLECAKTRAWPGPRLGVDSRGVPKESPVCGHRFATKGAYTVTATVHWEVTWNGAGESGVVPLQFSDSKTFEVVPLRTRVER